MGTQLVDRYTYLHFAVGIVAYFWNISILNWIIIQIIFEYLENTQIGMNYINKYITIWPGGKSSPDSVTNIIGDICSGSLGWLSAYYLDKLINKKSITII
jgi:hypothetical protein